MKLYEAKNIITEVFENPFDKDKFSYFIRNLLKNLHPAEFLRSGYNIPKAFEDFIASYERLGKYEDEEGNLIDVLIIKLKRDHSIDYARSTQRNFVRWYLNDKGKDAALVAFTTEKSSEWRFSFIKMQYSLEKKKDELTPAKRSSFLVGESGNSHTAQRQLIDLLKNDHAPYLSDIEDAFSIEAVSDEFYEKYKELLFDLVDAIKNIFDKDKTVRDEFKDKNISILNFSKKLLGQIVFLYFLQKKGWLGLDEKEKYGEGDKNFLRSLFYKTKPDENFFNDYLEFLFYDALSKRRVTDYYEGFKTRIPFLNGGLFDPIEFYDWQKTDIVIPNEIFSNRKGDEEGTGILDVFDLYNFTVKEDEPLETEVAIDPEMLGKVFERMLDVTERKSKGAFYTPREIVHYMAQQSLLYFLETELKENDVAKADLEKFIHYGEHIIDKDIAVAEGKLKNTAKNQKIPDSIKQFADTIDQALKNIKICDPAVGSGAFPVGIMNEIVKLRKLLTPFLKKESADERSAYRFKSNAIENSIYGVDIDAGAVEIAKLRLWLSMVVDEERIDTIEPLPNLEYKIVKGNSLISIPFDSARNVQLEDEINQLIKNYYSITHKDKKQEQKEIIDGKIQQLLASASEFAGYTIDFDFKLFFHGVFYQKQGFDIVLGNPPYVGQKGNQELFAKMKHDANFEKKMDYWYFFLYKAQNITSDHKIISYITPNYWITARGARILRKKIIEELKFLEWINFNDNNVFEAGIHTNLFFLKNEKVKNSQIKCTIYNEKLQSDIIARKPNQNNFQVSQEIIYNKWTNYVHFLPQNILNIINKICLNSEKLSDNETKGKIKKGTVAGKRITDGICNINQGIITGKDRFKDRSKKIDEGVYILNEKEVDELKLNSTELQYIKPFIKNSDISKYSINRKSNYNIIYVDEIENPSEFSKLVNIYNHLSKYRYLLGKRFINGVLKSAYSKGKWWALIHTVPIYMIKSEKIICPQRSRYNVFSYEANETYASADVYYITLNKDEYSLKYVLSILNSHLVYFWLYYMGKKKGEMLELYFEPLQYVPIKKINYQNQEPFIFVVDYILFLKSQLTDKMSFYFEQLIDGMVYELYFEKEIKQVGCDILKYLKDLPEISDEMTDEEKMKIITKVFNKLYDKESPVRKNLFFMDSVEEVAIIKNNLEK